MSPEQRAGEPGGYEHLSGPELVEAYRSGELPSTVVMGRCLDLTGRSGYRGKALPPFRGQTMLDEAGDPVPVERYLDYAEGHGPAITIICNFVAMNPDAPDHSTIAGAVAKMLDGYMGESEAQA